MAVVKKTKRNARKRLLTKKKYRSKQNKSRKHRNVQRGGSNTPRLPKPAGQAPPPRPGPKPAHMMKNVSASVSMKPEGPHANAPKVRVSMEGYETHGLLGKPQVLPPMAPGAERAPGAAALARGQPVGPLKASPGAPHTPNTMRLRSDTSIGQILAAKAAKDQLSREAKAKKSNSQLFTTPEGYSFMVPNAQTAKPSVVVNNTGYARLSDKGRTSTVRSGPSGVYNVAPSVAVRGAKSGAYELMSESGLDLKQTTAYETGTGQRKVLNVTHFSRPELQLVKHKSPGSGYESPEVPAGLYTQIVLPEGVYSTPFTPN